jgi:hypothetical protein
LDKRLGGPQNRDGKRKYFLASTGNPTLFSYPLKAAMPPNHLPQLTGIYMSSECRFEVHTFIWSMMFKSGYQNEIRSHSNESSGGTVTGYGLDNQD